MTVQGPDRANFAIAEMLLGEASNSVLGSEHERYLVAKAIAHAALGTGLVLAELVERIAAALEEATG